MGIEENLTIRSRNLPHLQEGGKAYFITFRSVRHHLSAEARQIVIDTIRFDEGRRFWLGCAAVMPDHVHMIIEPMQRAEGTWVDLADITKPIKGISARRINQLLGTNGPVWLDGSYDRLIRDREEFAAFWAYIEFNPVKEELAETAEDYPFFVKGSEESLLRILAD